jgi:hypothetical protein
VAPTNFGKQRGDGPEHYEATNAQGLADAHRANTADERALGCCCLGVQLHTLQSAREGLAAETAAQLLAVIVVGIESLTVTEAMDRVLASSQERSRCHLDRVD